MKFIALIFVSTLILYAELSVSNKYTDKQIVQEIQQKGIRKLAIDMADGTNEQVALQGGYISMDEFTNFVSARAKNNIYISNIQISKDKLIKFYAKQHNIQEKEVKKTLEEIDYIDIRNYVKNDLSRFNTNRMCSIREYKIFMKHGLLMQFMYSFDDGGMIDIHTVSYEMCGK